mmetsp:Transcript_5969/g.6729  ORF Transcript_5969/g.6729 Transcript_5969/m.6729 type:complete len:125 (+) Transcript_5969:131-505(+)
MIVCRVNKLPKFYLLDSVTKSVGGRYIEMFGEKIHTVYSTAFKESPNSVKKKLIMLLKTWYAYYPSDTLNTIYNSLEISKYEKELLTPEDHDKVKRFIDGVRREESKRRHVVPPLRHPAQPPMS